MSGIAGAVLGMMGGMYGATNQHRRQKALMGTQYQHQRMLNQQGHELQHEMWKKTNYPAQVKMMKEAGLNPALMYGSAGQGGSTGSQGGGSAASGSAAAFNPMDVSNMMLVKKQSDLIDAQTGKTKAETRDILGDTKESGLRIGNLAQDIENKKAVKELTDVQIKLNNLEAYIVKNTANARIVSGWKEYEKLVEDTIAIGLDNKLKSETLENNIVASGLEVTNLSLDNILKGKQIDLTTEQTKAIKEKVAQEWERVALEGDRVDIASFEAMIRAEYPSVWNVAGKEFNALFDTAEWIGAKLRGELPHGSRKPKDNYRSSESYNQTRGSRIRRRFE